MGQKKQVRQSHDKDARRIVNLGLDAAVKHGLIKFIDERGNHFQLTAPFLEIFEECMQECDKSRPDSIEKTILGIVVAYAPNAPIDEQMAMARMLTNGYMVRIAQALRDYVKSL